MKMGVHRKGRLVIALTAAEFDALRKPAYIGIRILGKSRYFAELKATSKAQGYKVGPYAGNSGHSVMINIKAPKGFKHFGMEEVASVIKKAKGVVMIGKPDMTTPLKRAPKKKGAKAKTTTAAPRPLVMTREEVEEVSGMLTLLNGARATYGKALSFAVDKDGVLSARFSLNIEL